MNQPVRVRIAGRAILLIGAAALLVSLSYPWVSLAGNQPSLPAGDYPPAQITHLATLLTGIPFTLPLYLWLFLVAAGAFVAAAAGRRARNLGSSAIIVIVLLAVLVWLATFTANTQNTSARAGFAVGWGIVFAVGSAILIEIGLRTTKPLRAGTARPSGRPIQIGFSDSEDSNLES